MIKMINYTLIWILSSTLQTWQSSRNTLDSKNQAPQETVVIGTQASSLLHQRS
ncbi:hypothetical protein M758_4G049300 [Ceratodon purpureus]|uniref:Uncharacterized protein n=1 Tax=Ceratodon purpureus TaxID=3225 RepID=A0A8T0I5V5_CERPU|nr:hypothetical protein KC19_4G052200 [Ceratodon purpureus]KAG0618254.1 hypothetical protein M758_4G049300 [Ceratodon purpureus]